MPTEEAICTQLIILVSNMCAFVVAFATVDRYLSLDYG